MSFRLWLQKAPRDKSTVFIKTRFIDCYAYLSIVHPTTTHGQAERIPIKSKLAPSFFQYQSDVDLLVSLIPGGITLFDSEYLQLATHALFGTFGVCKRPLCMPPKQKLLCQKHPVSVSGKQWTWVGSAAFNTISPALDWNFSFQCSVIARA